MTTDSGKAGKRIEELLQQDPFSRWLGVEVIAAGEGYCTLTMLIRAEMCNGFGITHGGLCFSLADSALAFASNSAGQKAVSLEASIAYFKALYPGERVIAAALPIYNGRTVGHYEVKITRDTGELVALFKGTVSRQQQ